MIDLIFCGAESWRRDTRVQLNTLMRYNILLIYVEYRISELKETNESIYIFVDDFYERAFCEMLATGLRWERGEITLSALHP